MSPRRFSRLGAPAAAALALLVTPALIKAVYVTPHAVFIDHDVKSAQVNLGNPGDAAEEVTVALMFGYSETDSLGTPVIRYIEEPGPEYPSAAGWIRAFPRRVRIEPGDRQVVRLLATPPADLPDGEYWTCLIVSSHGAAIPLATGDTAVRAGVTLEIRIVTSVIYRKGELGTEIIPLTHDPHSYAVSANIMQSRGIAWYRAV